MMISRLIHRHEWMMMLRSVQMLGGHVVSLWVFCLFRCLPVSPLFLIEVSGFGGEI